MADFLNRAMEREFSFLHRHFLTEGRESSKQEKQDRCGQNPKIVLQAAIRFFLIALWGDS